MSILDGRFLGKYNILIITLGNTDMETAQGRNAFSHNFQPLQRSLSLGLKDDGWWPRSIRRREKLFTALKRHGTFMIARDQFCRTFPAYRGKDSRGLDTSLPLSVVMYWIMWTFYLALVTLNQKLQFCPKASFSFLLIFLQVRLEGLWVMTSHLTITSPVDTSHHIYI